MDRTGDQGMRIRCSYLLWTYFVSPGFLSCLSFFLSHVVMEIIISSGLSPLQAPPLTSTGEPVMFQYMPPGPSEGPVAQVRDTGFHLDAKLGSGKPSLYMVLLSVCGCYHVLLDIWIVGASLGSIKSCVDMSDMLWNSAIMLLYWVHAIISVAIQ